MLYSFAKILMTAGLRFFFRHIYTTGLENVPAKGPAIIIANHNSSLMDAALLGILLKRKAWFFARGDVFVNKPIQKLLWWLHMLPVHGHQAGRITLDDNTNSFSGGQQLLLKGGIIVFFPESTSHVEHQLLPFRKGVFRLAFDTAKAAGFAFEIPIVPIGITYDHPVNCRTSVQVHAGKPLLLSHYKADYCANAAAALLHISRDAYQATLPLVLHMANRERLTTAEYYLETLREDYPEKVSSWKIASQSKLLREQAVCVGIDAAGEAVFLQKKQLAENYFSALTTAGVTDRAVSGELNIMGAKKAWYLCGWPFFLIGLLLNGLPVLIARWVANTKVYRADFYSWIFVACYSFMYCFWLLLAVFIFSFAGWPMALGLILLMVATGLFAYKYKGWLKEKHACNQWQALDATARAELKALRQKMVLG